GSSRQRLVRVIAAAHERSRLAVAEAEGKREPAVGRELVRVDPAVDRQVLRRRLEVLAEGEDLDAGLADVGDRRADLAGSLAEAEHDAGLDPALIVSRVATADGLGEQGEAAVVTASGAGEPI